MSNSLALEAPDALACCTPLAHEPLTAEAAAGRRSRCSRRSPTRPACDCCRSCCPTKVPRRACATCCRTSTSPSPPISHHLKVLHEAGLLDREKRGTWVFYAARAEAMAALAASSPRAETARDRTSRNARSAYPTRPAPTASSTLTSAAPLHARPFPARVDRRRHGRRARARPGRHRASTRLLRAIEIGSVSLPIAIGLLVMMYPVLAKVRYDEIGRVAGDRRLLTASVVLNWVVGPALMFALAWLLLPDLPDYRTGLIIVGLARCIAMVLIWNDLACGDREAAAVLVAVNAVFQILAFALLGCFYLEVLPGLARSRAGRSGRVGLGDRAERAGLPRHPAGRRVPDPHAGGAGSRPGVVRDASAAERSAPGRSTGCCSPSSSSSPSRATPSPASRSTSRASPYRCWPTSPSCGAARCCSPAPGPRLRARHGGLVHGGRQQLRARDRGGHRCLRGHLRPGAGRRRRPAHRGAGARRPRLRQPVGARFFTVTTDQEAVS